MALRRADEAELTSSLGEKTRRVFPAGFSSLTIAVRHILASLSDAAWKAHLWLSVIGVWFRRLILLKCARCSATTTLSAKFCHECGLALPLAYRIS